MRPTEILAKNLANLIIKNLDEIPRNYAKIYELARILARAVAPDDEKLENLIKLIELETNRDKEEILILDFVGLVLHKYERSLCQPIASVEKGRDEKEGAE